MIGPMRPNAAIVEPNPAGGFLVWFADSPARRRARNLHEVRAVLTHRYTGHHGHYGHCPECRREKR